MLKNMTVGQRLALGFGLLLLALALTVFLSFAGMGRTVGNAKEVIYGNRLDRIMAQKEVDHLNWAAQVTALLTDDEVTKLTVETDDHQCGLGQWLYSDARKEAEQRVPALASILREIEEPHHKLHQSATEIDRHFEQANAELPGLIAARMVDHLKWADAIRDAFLNHQTELAIETDPTLCALGKWLRSPEGKDAYAKAEGPLKEAWDAMLKTHKKLHESAVSIRSHIGKGEQGHTQAQKLFNETTLLALQETLTHLEAMKQAADEALVGRCRANITYTQQTVPALEQTRTLLHQVRETVQDRIMTEDAMLTAATATKRNVGLLGAIGSVAGVILAILIARSIIGPLKNIIHGLSEGSEQVAAAAGQVSSASQSLAEGATEQAAGLEETSSSLEQMSSMTRQNADNARQASTLAGDARQAADTGSTAMQRMNAAIEEIQKSSGETAKIIKVIDDIAFQTNLLALNAAVEAARAGEAGKGFAVVAEEVRNLAMRSAEAAKSTSNMIEQSVKNSQNGVEIATEVSAVLGEIVQAVSKTTGLIGEIAAASHEQSQGIDQVNTAVAQMDKVTQQNAANAEESASASEELSAQAESMNELVGQLVALVGGATSPDSNRRGRVLTQKVATKRSKESELSPSNTTLHRIAAGRSPIEAIPLGADSGDLDGFNA